jgi:hypothetical protein
MKGDHSATRRIHGDPDPLLIGFLLHEAGHFIGFHFKSLDQHIVLTGDRLDIQMVRQSFKALDAKAQESLEGDTHRATNTLQRETFHRKRAMSARFHPR